jgi:Recombination endonuclease VII
MRLCVRCKAEQEISCFGSDARYKDGTKTWCKSCERDAARRWRKNNQETVRESKLKHKFNITSSQYKTILDKQNGLCGICGQEETTKTAGKLRNLAVDHDRSCCPGERSCGQCIRGLLCQACNTGIGKLGDSVLILQGAINYLNKHNPKKGESK